MSPHANNFDDQNVLSSGEYEARGMRPQALLGHPSPTEPGKGRKKRPTFRRESTDDFNKRDASMNTPWKHRLSDYFGGIDRTLLEESLEEDHPSPTTKLLDAEYVEIPSHHQPPPTPRCAWPSLTLFLLLIILIQAIVILSPLISSHPTRSSMSSSSSSRETTFPSIPPETQTPLLKRFSYALHAYDNGTLYPYPHASPYTGPNASSYWKELITPRYFRLTNDEVEKLNGVERRMSGRMSQDLDPDTRSQGQQEAMILEKLPYWTEAVEQEGYYGGVDMLHSLHCLDSLRRVIDRGENEDHGHRWRRFEREGEATAERIVGDGGAQYEEGDMLLLPGESRRLHLDHCLEQLRQAILCHADATPVTLRPIVSEFVDGDGRKNRVLTMLGETERVHRCDGDGLKLAEWVKGMAKDRGSV